MTERMKTQVAADIVGITKDVSSSYLPKRIYQAPPVVLPPDEDFTPYVCSAYTYDSGSILAEGNYKVLLNGTELTPTFSSLDTIKTVLEQNEISMYMFDEETVADSPLTLRVKSANNYDPVTQTYVDNTRLVMCIDFEFNEGNELVIDYGNGVVHTLIDPPQSPYSFDAWFLDPGPSHLVPQYPKATVNYTYPVAGTYTVTIRNNKPIRSLSFNQLPWIEEVLDWGSDIKYNIQVGGDSLIQVPNYIPKYVRSLHNTLYGSRNFNSANVSNWDVSHVWDFSGCFEDCEIFNQPLNWDVRRGTSFNKMLYDCYTFNDPSISLWQFDEGRDFLAMLKYCQALTQKLPTQYPKALNMEAMLDGCTLYTHSADDWHTPLILKYPGSFEPDGWSTVSPNGTEPLVPHWSERSEFFVLHAKMGTLNIEVLDGETINWGDGSPLYTHVGAKALVSHTYATNPPDSYHYEVRVHVVESTEWRLVNGTALYIVAAWPITAFARGVHFDDSVNLGRVPFNIPKYFRTMSYMFKGCIRFNSNVEWFTTELIEDMSYCFMGCTDLGKQSETNDVLAAGYKNWGDFYNGWEGPLSSFSLLNCTNATAMFKNCANYNPSSYYVTNLCVPLLLSEPFEMFAGTSITARPVWGTCPA